MGENYFFVYGKELEAVAWGEVYPKNIDADRYAVSLDMGDGRDYCVERIYDKKTGIFECTVNEVSREGLEELLRGTNL